jgi:hypothetical protein
VTYRCRPRGEDKKSKNAKVKRQKGQKRNPDWFGRECKKTQRREYAIPPKQQIELIQSYGGWIYEKACKRTDIRHNGSTMDCVFADLRLAQPFGRRPDSRVRRIDAPRRKFRFFKLRAGKRGFVDLYVYLAKPQSRA